MNTSSKPVRKDANSGNDNLARPTGNGGVSKTTYSRKTATQFGSVPKTVYVRKPAGLSPSAQVVGIDTDKPGQSRDNKKGQNLSSKMKGVD